ncbi:MAG: hypothetical protein IT232_06980 [Flavobacteriales bacterium]|nr:hypothetical protein [Flavobacteriales bacterium]
MQILKDKNNRAGIIGTIGIHSLLLILFLFVGMSYPDPPPPEEGITINFGNSDEGMGETESQELMGSTSKNTESSEDQLSQTSNTEQSITTQNTSETVPVNATKNNEPKNNEQPIEEKKQTTSKNLSEALNAFNQSGSNSNSDGITGNPGNQGDPNGDPNSKNYVGGGNRNGVEYSLSGRVPLSLPKIDDNSQEKGFVFVDIVVDKYGKVIRATNGRGTTILNETLIDKAIKAAFKAKFNAKPELNTDQKGTMKFTFLLN